MRRNKVRGRDGAIREVSDGYVLCNGEASVVDLPFMDAKTTIVHDGRGQPAGQRPAFLYSDGNEQARVDAYSEYSDAIGNRWQSHRWQSPPSKQPSSKPPLVFDSPEAAVAAAYTEYSDAIQQRWCK